MNRDYHRATFVLRYNAAANVDHREVAREIGRALFDRFPAIMGVYTHHRFSEWEPVGSPSHVNERHGHGLDTATADPT